jgi:hypothetical protein
MPNKHYTEMIFYFFQEFYTALKSHQYLLILCRQDHSWFTLMFSKE